jgi:hypothetical protein
MFCVNVNMLLIRGVAYALSATILTFATHPARAETVNSALVKAYRNNPQLNAERASADAAAFGFACGGRGNITIADINAKGERALQDAFERRA